MRKIFPHTIAESINRLLTALLILVLATTTLLAQNPAPTPTDKRDLGLQPNQQPTPQATQTKAIDFKTVVDNSVVDRLVKEGFFEKLFGAAIKSEQENRSKQAMR